MVILPSYLHPLIFRFVSMRTPIYLLLALLLFGCHSTPKTDIPALTSLDTSKKTSISTKVAETKASIDTSHINRNIGNSKAAANKNANKAIIAEDMPTAEVSLEPKYYIKQGSIRNTFVPYPGGINFKSFSVNSEDSRVGCSGGNSTITFAVANVRDTFYIENENLRKLNFTYEANGGLAWAAQGANPAKGYISGKLLPDSTWHIQINVWLMTIDQRLEQKQEQQIKLNQIFTR